MKSGGKVYALNGRAMGNAQERGWLIAKDTITIMSEYDTPASTISVIERGLAMC